MPWPGSYSLMRTWFGALCGEEENIPSLSKRDIIGESSHSGSGEAKRVFDLLSADGHVWRRRRDNCVHLGCGTVVIFRKDAKEYIVTLACLGWYVFRRHHPSGSSKLIFKSEAEVTYLAYQGFFFLLGNKVGDIICGFWEGLNPIFLKRALQDRAAFHGCYFATDQPQTGIYGVISTPVARLLNSLRWSSRSLVVVS